MDDLDKIESELLEVQSGLKGFLVRDWAYIAMLFFALLGVALTTVERELMSFYWLILVPVFGFICVIESWRRHYNTIRPHASIGYKPPAPEVFVPAFAAWPAALRRPAPPATLAQRPTLN